MSQTTWNIIKQSKCFYVKTYRVAGSFLVFSLLVNLSLACLIYYCYFNQAEPNYYATDGVRPPLTLMAMDRPNNSSVPLLAADPVEPDESLKVMMQ